MNELSAFEAEFEHALRIIEERAELRSKQFDEERQRLHGEIEAATRRSEIYVAELAVEHRKTMIAQSSLSIAERRLVSLEQTLDAIEDEVEETIQKIGVRTSQEIAAMDQRLREEIRRCDAAETEAGRVRSLEAEVARLQPFEAEACRLQALEAELSRIRASNSWRLTAPFRKWTS